MNWIRYENGFKTIHQGMAFTFIFSIWCFIFLQPWLAASFAAIFAMLAFQNSYFSKVGKDLKVNIQSKQKRILTGGEEELILEFENGIVPIWNGTLTLSIEDPVAPSNDNRKHYSGIYDLSVPFAVGSNKKVEIRIPLEGKKRGMSRVTRLMLEVPHLFGDGSVNMELEDPLSYQSLVYPRVTAFEGELNSSPFKPGEIEQKQSLFTDTLQMIGTRDYVPSDRFDQIHWTASAKMQKLQTKEFLPVSAQSVALILNAVEKDRGYNDFEKKVERLVSYADYCTKNNIPYSVSINLRTFGATPFLQLQSGSGKVQFQKTMVMLAKISDKHAKMRYEDMLLNMESAGQLPQTIVLITHENEKVRAVAQKWSKQYTVIMDTASEGSGEEWNNPVLKKTGTDSSIPSA